MEDKKYYLRDLASVLLLITILLFFIFSLNFLVTSWLTDNYYSSYDTQRILELLLLIISGALVIISNQQSDHMLVVIQRLPRLSRIFLLLILASGLTSCWLAPIPQMALLEVSLYVLLFFFILMVATQRIAWGDIMDDLLMNLVLITVILYLTYYLYCFVMLLYTEHSIMLTFPGFINIRFFSEYQIWTIPILTSFVCIKSKSFNFLFLLLGLWWTLAIANGAKGLWLCYAVALLATMLIFRKRGLPFLFTNLKAIFTGLLLVFFLYYFIPNALYSSHLDTTKTTQQTIENPKTIFQNNVFSLDSSAGARKVLWHQALTLLNAHFLWGVGPMHYAYYPQSYGAHPHNILLLFASEWGLPVCCVMLLLILWGMKAWISACYRNKNQQPLIAMGLTCSMLAGLFYSLLGGAMVTPVSQVTLCIIFGWAMGYYQIVASPKKNILTPNFLLICIIIILVVTSITVIFTVAYPQLDTLPKQEYQWLLQHQSDPTFHPRFWLQGWLRS